MQPKLKELLSNKRFIQIVGMLGSAHAGEAGNAAVMATEMLTKAGLTWGEVVQGGSSGSSGGLDELELIRKVRRLEHDVRQAQEMHVAALEKWQKDKSALKRAREENTKLIEQQAAIVHELRALKMQMSKLREVRDAKKAEAK